MADKGYVHGILVKEGSGEVQIIRSPGQSTVGIVGTAPQSEILRDNTPVSYFGSRAALAAIYPDGATGEKGTLYDAAMQVQAQTPTRMILIKARSGSEADILSAIDAFVDAESVTGYIPKILIGPGFGNSNPAPQSSLTLSLLSRTAKANTLAPPVATSGETKNG